MRPIDDDIQQIRARFQKIEWALDERMRRLFAASEASALGRGGVTKVSKATGISRRAIHAGLAELNAEQRPPENREKRIRKAGGGRRSVIETESGVLVALEQLLEPMTSGDPDSPLRWTCKSLRALSAELSRQGCKVSYPKVSDLLKQLGYSLKAHRTTPEGADHPDRHSQFEFINDAATQCMAAGEPVISIDIKKKEQNRAWRQKVPNRRPAEEPEFFKIHDCIDNELGAATPHSLDDFASDTEWVCVGTDHDTASFAIETIWRWWETIGRQHYPKASKLMITADGCGGNGSREGHWKRELQKFSNEINLPIEVSHLPPGTSKWNSIEHRLFSYFSMTCRGQSSISHEVVINLISGTPTKNGLTAHTGQDDALCTEGLQVSAMKRQAITIARDAIQGDWNYRIDPGPA
jgi:transposase